VLFSSYNRDFDKIYVDLQIPDGSHRCSNRYYDDDGAIICNKRTNCGTPLRQLSYEEFLKYLDIRCVNRDVEFVFRGKKEIHVSDTLWNIHTSSHITFNSQYDDSFTLSVICDTDIIDVIGVSSSITIKNMDMDVKSGIVRFIYDNQGEDSTPDNYSLTVENSRIWMDTTVYQSYAGYPVYAIMIVTGFEVKFINNIFNNMSGDTNATIINIPILHYFPDLDSVYIAYVGNIFIRFNEFNGVGDRGGKFKLVALWNTFSGDVSTFMDSTPSPAIYNFIQYAGTDTNEFNWTTYPSIVDTYLYDDAIYLDKNTVFYYMSTEWDSISHMIDRSHARDINGYILSTSDYGKRDGKGALYFRPMEPVAVDVSPKRITSPTDVTFKLTDSTYDADFQPNSYIWYIGDDTLFTSAPVVRVEDVGLTEAKVYVYSHNAFYSVHNTSYVKYVGVFDDDILIYTTNDDGTVTNEFEIGDNVHIYVQNNTTTNDISSIKVRYNGRESVIHPTPNGGTSSFTTVYDTINIEHIFCDVYFTYNSMTTISHTIRINDILIPEVYYVDLSKEYSDKYDSSLKYAIYDDFEDGSISSHFNTEFVSNYSVSTMFDDKVATGTSLAKIIDGLLYGIFKLEWSFVRTSEDDFPYYIISTDIGDVSITWDFIKNIVIIEYNGYIKKLFYGEHILDLNCPDAINTLYADASYDTDSDELLLSFGFDYDEYIVNDSIHLSFNELSVKTRCTTNTGLGFVSIQSESVDTTLFDGFIKGTEEYPFTFNDMYDSMISDGVSIYSIYKCRNYRVITREDINYFNAGYLHKYHIDAWDSDMYGPWVMVFDVPFSVYMANLTLSNGIIYNIVNGYNNDLYISTLFDMIISWNGSSDNNVLFVPTVTRYSGTDKRVDIVGSTIKANSNIYIANEE